MNTCTTPIKRKGEKSEDPRPDTPDQALCRTHLTAFDSLRGKLLELWILNACNRDQRRFLKFQHEIIKTVSDIVFAVSLEQRNITLNFFSTATQ